MKPGLIPLLLAVAPLTADEVQLEDGGRLTGRVRDFGVNGRLTLESPLSTGPLQLRAEEVVEVGFSGAASQRGEHDARVTLLNGDVLPCNLSAIDEEGLQVTTRFAGGFTVPREVVRTVQLGIRPARMVFRGPENLEGWKVEENWDFKEGSLVSGGRGSVSRTIDEMPDSFSLSFKLAWASRPNFQIFFCSDVPDAGGGKHDRYYLQFNSGGMELKRQSSEGNPYQSVADIPRPPDSFAERQAEFELRLDRRQRLLLVYVDGELEGRYPDPHDKVPTGKTLILSSNSSTENAHRVSDIVVREWDAAGERHKSEDRGDTGQDALIDNLGDRYRGRLIGSRGSGEDLVLLFKSQHFPEPLEIPARRVSTLFFRATEFELPDEAPLVLVLAEDGRLGTTACTFRGEEVALSHPLLGDLNLDRPAVRVLKRRAADEEADDESEPESQE